MRNGKVFIAVFGGIAGLLLTGFLGGCFNASANVDTSGFERMGRAWTDDSAGSRPDRAAVQSAREAAIEAGIPKDQLSEYLVSTKLVDKVWWVRFRHQTLRGDSWPARFVVSVDPDGRTRLYKDATNSP